MHMTYITFMNKFLCNKAMGIMESIANEFEVLIVKGPILSGYLYGDSCPRKYSDIDFLVEKNI